MLFSLTHNFVGSVLSIAPMWNLGTQPIACEANRMGPEVVRWTTANPGVSCQAYWSAVEGDYIIVCPD